MAVTAEQRVAVHRLVLWDKLRGEDAPCHWCGRQLVWKSSDIGTRASLLVADHVDGDVRNNAPGNLVPSCRGCNGNRNGPRRPVRACVICGAMFTARQKTKTCSISCGVKLQWREGRAWHCRP